MLLSDSLHKQCVPALDIFDIRSILQHRGLQKTILHNTDSRHLSVPHLSPSSDPEETADYLDDEEIGGFLTLFSSLYHVFDAKFCSGRGFVYSFLLFSFCCLVNLGQRDFLHLSFVPLSVGLALYFSLLPPVLPCMERWL
jgi:hypothetical protein